MGRIEQLEADGLRAWSLQPKALDQALTCTCICRAHVCACRADRNSKCRDLCRDRFPGRIEAVGRVD